MGIAFLPANMNKLLLCLALVASCSAYTGVTGNCAACATAAGAASNYCAHESSSNCGCNSCGAGVVNAFRITETTDLEEQTTQTAQWGRRRRRFFDSRRRRRRFFDYRRRRRRTSYPTPYPTTAFPTAFPTAYPTAYPTAHPTGLMGHNTCKKTTCEYKNGITYVTTFKAHSLKNNSENNWHCEKPQNGRACRCVCHKSLQCSIRHYPKKSDNYKAKSFLRKHC